MKLAWDRILVIVSCIVFWLCVIMWARSCHSFQEYGVLFPWDTILVEDDVLGYALYYNPFPAYITTTVLYRSEDKRHLTTIVIQAIPIEYWQIEDGEIIDKE